MARSVGTYVGTLCGEEVEAKVQLQLTSVYEVYLPSRLQSMAIVLSGICVYLSLRGHLFRVVL
jgi:hypothetical protein